MASSLSSTRKDYNASKSDDALSKLIIKLSRLNLNATKPSEIYPIPCRPPITSTPNTKSTNTTDNHRNTTFRLESNKPTNGNRQNQRIEAKPTQPKTIAITKSPQNGILECDTNGNCLVQIHPEFVARMKPHQVEGVKFMYDCIIESVDRLQEDKQGSGCILAHSMGLGKTFQVVAFLHSILTSSLICGTIQRILLIVPYNVIENWANEFEKWLNKCKISWNVEIFEMRTVKTPEKRLDLLAKWNHKGGILLITNNLYSRLVAGSSSDCGKKRELRQAFLCPGPDLVIIDEGHLLKNDETQFHQALSRIETHRRVVLTGTPLQNNLSEYFVLLNYIKPGLLGSKNEFKRRFQDPIERGQYYDSTEHQVGQMKKRVYVLHKILERYIHRRGYDILVPFLQPKSEYVLSVKLSEMQIKMYRYYLDTYVTKADGKKVSGNYLRDKNILSLIWTHPALVHEHHLESQNKTTDNFDISKTDDWYRKFVPSHRVYELELGPKMMLLFELLELCQEVGDKLVLFSQSLLCLNLIERFLNSQLAKCWTRDVDYFRIDGSVASEERSDIIEQFNDLNNSKARLILVSTRAGGIGTNLIGANRAIIFDTSFNPANDQQAIFRIYRLGQTKPVYVYRFNSAGTLEDIIYKRQIVKQSLSGRVLDESQLERHYSKKELDNIYNFDSEYKSSNRVIATKTNDKMLNELVAKHSDLIVSIHEHDSLLQNRPHEELSVEERNAALLEYQHEVKLEKSGNR